MLVFNDNVLLFPSVGTNRFTLCGLLRHTVSLVTRSLGLWVPLTTFYNLCVSKYYLNEKRK